MQITSRFTIAVHIIACIEYFKDIDITSNFLSGSIGANSVIVRTVISYLKKANIIEISQGKSGIKLKKSVNKITFYDIYKALDCINDDMGLFHFHTNPNIKCPIGKNIHKAMAGKLLKIQTSMETEMKKITVSNVIKDIIKEIKNQ